MLLLLYIFLWLVLSVCLSLSGLGCSVVFGSKHVKIHRGASEKMIERKGQETGWPFLVYQRLPRPKHEERRQPSHRKRKEVRLKIEVKPSRWTNNVKKKKQKRLSVWWLQPAGGSNEVRQTLIQSCVCYHLVMASATVSRPVCQGLWSHPSCPLNHSCHTTPAPWHGCVLAQDSNSISRLRCDSPIISPELSVRTLMPGTRGDLRVMQREVRALRRQQNSVGGPLWVDRCKN